ncbi:MAG: PA14 domain-containing protein [Planctomycetota bacterium]|nr:PA14 domain-containing protein [Planctomycetota bacterium]
MSRHNALKMLGLLVAAIACLLSWAPAVQATEYTWTNDGGTQAWDMEANWESGGLGGYPTAPDTATLSSTDVGRIGDVYLNGDREVHTLNLMNDSGTYTIKPGPDPHTLTAARIVQSGGVASTAANEIQADLYGALDEDLGVSLLRITQSSGTLKLSGQVGMPGDSVIIGGSSVTNGKLEFAAAQNYITGAVVVGPGGELVGSDANLGTILLRLAGGTATLHGQRILRLPGIKGEFYGSMPDTAWPANPRGIGQDRILLPLNGAGFDPISPGGASYNAGAYKYGFYERVMNPGTGWDTGGNPFVDAAGIDLKDINGSNVNFGGDNVASRWTTYLNITVAGDYRFRSCSDDGSKIWVDGAEQVYNDYWQGMTWRESGNVNLGVGWHTMVVGWYEGGGGAGLQIEYMPPGGGWQAFPSFHPRRRFGLELEHGRPEDEQGHLAERHQHQPRGGHLHQHDAGQRGRPLRPGRSE